MCELGKEFAERDETEVRIGWARPTQFERVCWKSKRFGPNVQGYCDVYVQRWEIELQGHQNVLAPVKEAA